MDLNKKCFITKDVLVNKKKIKFMYHEQPDNESDSGWRFFSGDETQEYVDDSNNLIFISLLEVIQNVDSSIEKYLNYKNDIAFERSNETEDFKVSDYDFSLEKNQKENHTRKGKFGVCSSHRINYDWLKEDIIEYLQNICEEFCKYYDFNELEDNSEEIMIKNLREINKKIEKVDNEINFHKNMLGSLHMNKVSGLVDRIEIYKDKMIYVHLKFSELIVKD